MADRIPKMTPEAVTERLREVGRLLAQQGLRRKGVDMSPAAVTARLQSLGNLSDACRRLGRARFE